MGSKLAKHQAHYNIPMLNENRLTIQTVSNVLDGFIYDETLSTHNIWQINWFLAVIRLTCQKVSSIIASIVTLEDASEVLNKLIC